MKYSEKYPNMEPIVGGGIAPDTIMRGRESKSCWICGEQTEYIDLCFEAHTCITETVRQGRSEEASKIAEDYSEQDEEVIFHGLNQECNEKAWLEYAKAMGLEEGI